MLTMRSVSQGFVSNVGAIFQGAPVADATIGVTLQDRMPFSAVKLEAQSCKAAQDSESPEREATSSEEPTEDAFQQFTTALERHEPGPLHFLTDGSAAGRQEESPPGLLNHSELSGFLNLANDDVSALLRRVKDEAAPLYFQAEQLLGPHDRLPEMASSCALPI